MLRREAVCVMEKEKENLIESVSGPSLIVSLLTITLTYWLLKLLQTLTVAPTSPKSNRQSEQNRF